MTLASFIMTLVTMSVGYMISLLANKKVKIFTAFTYLFFAAAILNFLDSKIVSSMNSDEETSYIAGAYVGTINIVQPNGEDKEAVEYSVIRISVEGNKIHVNGFSFFPNGSIAGVFNSTRARYNPDENKLEYKFVGHEGQKDFGKKIEGTGFFRFNSPTKYGPNQGYGTFKNPISKTSKITDIYRVIVEEDPKLEKGAYNILCQQFNLDWSNLRVNSDSTNVNKSMVYQSPMTSISSKMPKQINISNSLSNIDVPIETNILNTNSPPLDSTTLLKDHDSDIEQDEITTEK